MMERMSVVCRVFIVLSFNCVEGSHIYVKIVPWHAICKNKSKKKKSPSPFYICLRICEECVFVNIQKTMNTWLNSIKTCALKPCVRKNKASLTNTDVKMEYFFYNLDVVTIMYCNNGACFNCQWEKLWKLWHCLLFQTCMIFFCLPLTTEV